MADPRIVYGVRCAWWDSIDKAGTNSSGLPCCPHCSRVLFEMPTEADWWAGVDRYTAANEPDYRRFIEWLRGKCFPNHTAARAAFGEAALRLSPGGRPAVDL